MLPRKAESGQIVILFALMIIGLLGFAALAIDGGNVYAQRRQAQNAADAAALAAALAGLEGGNFEAVALSQAELFGFTNTSNVQVEVFHPPISGKYAPPYYDSFKYYQVFVHVASKPVLAQVVLGELLKNSVEAVARAQPNEPPFPGDALVATSALTCNAMTFDGGGQKTVRNGNVFSNSSKAGSPTSCVSAIQSGGGTVTVYDGGIRTVGTLLKKDTAGAIETIPASAIQQFSQSQIITTYPLPSCTQIETTGEKNVSASDTVADPGWYPNGIDVKSNLTLNSGVYCLGGDLRVTGGNSLTGNDVFIIMMDGSIDTTGGSLVNLSAAPHQWTLGELSAWESLLIYVYPDNEGVVNLGGGNTSSYTGTIYATSPSNSESQPKCDIGGATKSGEKLSVIGQVICYTITVRGNAAIDVTYNAAKVSKTPRNISLVR